MDVSLCLVLDLPLFLPRLPLRLLQPQPLPQPCRCTSRPLLLTHVLAHPQVAASVLRQVARSQAELKAAHKAVVVRVLLRTEAATANESPFGVAALLEVATAVPHSRVLVVLQRAVASPLSYLLRWTIRGSSTGGNR